MPEAPIEEHSDLLARKHKVGCPPDINQRPRCDAEA